MMKMDTLKALMALANGNEALTEALRDEMASLEKADARKAEQKAVKMAEYAEAHDAVMAVLADAVNPVTMGELFEACEDTLPDGFTKAKLSYALRALWADEVVKAEGKVNTYALKA